MLCKKLLKLISSLFFILPGCRSIAPSTLQEVPPSVAEEPYIFSEKQLFDPHSHINGILPPAAYANLTEYLRTFGAYQPNPQELSELLAFILSKYESSHRFSTLSLGSKMTMACAKSRTALGQNSAADLNGFINLLLTASPWTNFDSAYDFRDHAAEWMAKHEIENLKIQICPNAYVASGSCSYYAIAVATLIELMRHKIVDSEISIGAIGGVSQGKMATLELYRDLVNQIKKQDDSDLPPLWKNIYAQIRKLQFQTPSIRWLLMTHTTEFAQTNETKDHPTDSSESQYSATMDHEGPFIGCHPRAGLLRTISIDSFTERTLKLLSDRTDIGGFDTAGPEKTCFTDSGMEHYRTLLQSVLKIAESWRKRDPKAPKILVRTHVGEGFPAMEYTGLLPAVRAKLKAAQTLGQIDATTLSQSCQGFTAIPQIQKNQGGRYAHYDPARDNIDKILDSIESFLKANQNALDLIQLRLGHVTHTTPAQAQKMAQWGIYADVNLTSNISTGSFIIDGPWQKDNLEFYKSMEMVHFLNFAKSTLSKSELSKQFFDHGLRHLVAHGVPTLLGTDGGGVEHSQPFLNEFVLGESLIENWFSDEKIDLKKSSSYFFNSANHYRQDRLSQKKPKPMLP